MDTPFEYNLIYEYNLLKRELKQLEGFRLLGPRFDSSKYTAYQMEVAAEDGELIPVTMVHRKKLVKNRSNKTLLSVYGCYGLNNEVEFDVVNLKALEEGWVLAYAHVRGGGEKGA